MLLAFAHLLLARVSFSFSSAPPTDGRTDGRMHALHCTALHCTALRLSVLARSLLGGVLASLSLPVLLLCCRWCPLRWWCRLVSAVLSVVSCGVSPSCGVPR